jgi:hypothetical protein
VRDAPRDVACGAEQVASQSATQAGGSGDVASHCPLLGIVESLLRMEGAIPSSATRAGRRIAGPRPPRFIPLIREDLPRIEERALADPLDKVRVRICAPQRHIRWDPVTTSGFVSGLTLRSVLIAQIRT